MYVEGPGREGDKIRFVYVRCDGRQNVGMGEEEVGEAFDSVQVLGMNEDLWDGLRGLGSETWKGYEWVELLVVWTRPSGSRIIFLIS